MTNVNYISRSLSYRYSVLGPDTRRNTAKTMIRLKTDPAMFPHLMRLRSRITTLLWKYDASEMNSVSGGIRTTDVG